LYPPITLPPYHSFPSFLFRYEVNDNSLYISSISNYAYKKRVDFFLSRSSSSHSLSEPDSVSD
uniref:hypothetical protein n=1 Tax=Bacteroides intestinalis TaxID=329854 RepID=UPI003FEF062C